MIILMTTTGRPQQRYDHRLRDLVRGTGDVTIAKDLGVPRSTARGWLRATPTVVVGLDVLDLTEPELSCLCTFPREFSSPRRTLSCRRTARTVLAKLSAVTERPMIIPHDDHGAPAAALRPPASGSRPRHHGTACGRTRRVRRAT